MEKKKTRSSNIELLRILAMFMIVIYHITCHCVTVQLTDPGSMGRTVVDTFNHPVFYTRLLILNSLMTFGIIGNAIFILISGYFMANRGGDRSKNRKRIQEASVAAGICFNSFGLRTADCTSP